MTLQVLMTPDCQVICIGEDGQFYSRSLTGNGPVEGLVGLIQQGSHWYIRSVAEPVRWYDGDAQAMVSLLPSQGVTFDVRGIGLRVLRSRDHYMSVDWSGTIKFDTQDASAAAVLRAVPLDDLMLLQEMSNKRWVCGPGGKQAKIELEKSTLEDIFIGDVKVSFGQFMEAARQSLKHGDLLLNEEWKAWRFTVFNPLIVVEAFGEHSLAELELALSSLSHVGQYKGGVMITTNQPESDVLACVPDVYDRDAVRCVVVQDHDRFAALRTRARLMADPAMLEEYTPLVFINSGVIFDGHIESFLGRCALARKISAREYFFHPEFSTDQKELAAINGMKAGHTADFMVVPHVSLHRPYLEMAFDLLTLCIREYGESVIPADAQSILNYGLRQVGDFSASLVEEALNHENDMTLNPFRAIGITGFSQEEGRIDRMARYYENVRELWGVGA